MTVIRKPGRFAALLLGALMAAAGLSAGGAPAMASPGTGHADVRAEVLALLGHHGLSGREAGSSAGARTAMRGLRTAIPMPGTRSALNGVF